jgi:N-methylhydantoinase B/oxoprolinase/acetone carboxylase alpha subunit
VQLTTTNEIAELTLAGGSGCGDPRKRPREAILRDVALGYVTQHGARRDYGLGDDEAAQRAPDVLMA